MSLQLPDCDRLSHNFGVIAEEFSKLPNLAVMQEAQTLANITNVLVEIRQSVNAIQTEMASLRTDVTTLRTDVTMLRTDVTALRTDMTTNVATLQTDMTALRTEVTTLRSDLTNRLDTSEVNTQARLHNSRVRVPLGDLHPLATRYGIHGPTYPPNFPRTSEVIFGLRIADIDPLLTAYNLPIPGTVVEKRRRFAEFIGL